MKTCRMCQSINLYKFLDLGFTPLADQFRRKDQLLESEIYYPLNVYVCDSCGLVQLGHVVSPEILYRNDYPYESSTTATGKKHWNEFASSVVERFNLSKKDLVVDIGSNVGVLLKSFKDRDIRICGIDPAANIVIIAQQNNIETICDFFNEDSAKEIIKRHGKASVITATNVFAHVDDLTSFMKNLETLLNVDGIFIFEAPYFGNLLKNLEYDTIYHEHLSYFSLKPLIKFFEKFNMEIFDIEFRDIHGGSFRVYVSKKSKYPVNSLVNNLLFDEERNQIYSHSKLNDFADSVKNNRDELIWLLLSLKHENKKIVGVSAPAKGMTLINYCKIGDNILDFITEKSELKIGRFTPGMHIPVKTDDALLEEKPDYALLLAWNFADEIIKNNFLYLKNGGKFIIPIPKPTIIDKVTE
jgi:SAM-dependent methyltransferase